MLRSTDTALDALAGVIATMPGATITLDVSATPPAIDGDTLTVHGTSTATWPVEGLPGASLKLQSATLTVTSAGATTASVAATLPVTPSVAPPVTVQPLETQPGAWSVTLTGPAGGLTPTELLALGLGSGPLPFDIPPSLDVFGQLATVDPATFAIHFAPGESGSSAYFAFGVSVTTGTWHLIPDVIDFTGLDLAAVITTGAWSVTVIGHLGIGGVPVALAIGVGSSSVWSASLAPDGSATFPGIVELADWFSGGSGLGQQTQTGFGALGLNPSTFDLALSGVELSFDVSTAKVVDLQISSVLTVIGLQLDLVLGLPAITLVGSLARPGTTVVSMLTSAGLSTAGVPTTLAINTASFSADASTASYSAGVVVDGIWPTGPLQLQEVGATIGYTAGAFTGTFDATLGVAGGQLGLSASYDNGGWTFAGRTPAGSTLSIGALLSDLATKFGITTVPAAVASLTLTALDVSYASATGAFHFGCTSTLDVEGTPVTLVATIDVTTTSEADKSDPSVSVGNRGYSARFGGTITLDNLAFDLVFDLADDRSDIFVADYAPVKDAGSTQLKALVAALSATLAGAVPEGITVDLKEVKFCFYKATATLWTFGLRLGTTIDLSQLPVVGSHLPPDLSLGIDDLQALYANAAFTPAQIKAVNAVLPSRITKLPDTLAAGIALQGTLRLGDHELPIGTGVTGNPPPKAPGQELAVRPTASPPATSTDPITWVDVNKQFGIFTFRRVGIGYADNMLLFSLDASVALGPLAFSMQALTVGSPLDRFAPTFSLGGLSLSFSRPPITLGGAFVKVTQTIKGRKVDAYYGDVLVSVPQFSLSAVGGWAPDADPAMFFIYVAVDAPIGGPPFLQISGLAGGFGINSRLVLPDVDHVGSYVLLPGPSVPKQPEQPADVLSTVLPALSSTFQIEAGQYWVAAGIAASSFEMITVKAVISVGFGVDVQIGVVGSGSMTLPTGDPYPVAYVEIDVVASYTPSTGVLSIIGKLSPASYLFGGFVKLTGGFALCAWFADTPPTPQGPGNSAGDFVVTLGGYHPAFDKPPGYPVVPRLGIAFALGPIKVTGQAYFALTPGAFMAGLALEATFEAGPISAWFSAGLDFLISWSPFHYQAHAWVAIGCRVDLGLFSIRVQIGADLQLWGPPFGGQAVVDLDVVSFTISFGAAAEPPAPVGWSTMAANFLPPPTPAKQPARATRPGPLPALDVEADAEADADATVTGVVTATVTQGLLSSTTPGVDWVVDGNHFRIAVRTTVPVNHPALSTDAQDAAELPNLVSAYTREVVVALRAGAAGASEPPPLLDVLPADLRLALDPATQTFSPTQVWQPDLDIGPMGQHDVNSHLTLTLLRRDEDGDSWSTYITDLTLLPQLNAVTAALWSNGAAVTDVNGQRLVPGALTGLDLAPVPQHPDAVNDVALLALVFAEGVSTGFVDQANPTPSVYTVSGTVTTEPGASSPSLEITVGGAYTADLTEEDYQLTALVDPWIAGQRAALLDELVLLGFATPPSSAVHLDELAEVPLSDWPGVALIGQPA